MRTQQGKSLKRGRKPKNKGKGKKGTGKGDTSPQTLPRKKSKRSLLKAANEKGKRSPPKKVKKPNGDSVVPKKKSKTVDTTKTDSGIEPGKMAQGRFNVGNGWVYEILPGQYYGCRSCRFIYGGCGHCQKDTFRGVRASAALLKQQEYPKEQYQANTTSSQQGEVKKVKKAKAKKKAT